MFNFALFKQGVRSQYKLLLIFILILSLYFGIIVSMYDPSTQSILEALTASMSDMMAMFGMDGNAATLTGFLASYLYGFLMLLFPMLYSILSANRLCARQIDRGSMAYLLASPNSRGRVIRTQLLCLLSGLTLLIVYCTLFGVLCSEAMFPGKLDIPAFLLLNLGVFCLQLALAGISFFASCLSDDTRLSLTFGAGIPLLFYLVQMLANMGGKLENLKYFTLFTLFDIDGLLARQTQAVWMAGSLAGLGIVLFATGSLLFCNRDLPL